MLCGISVKVRPWLTPAGITSHRTSTDYEVLDANDTLDGNPGDDPLDRGVAAPDRWSAGTRYALEGEEESESLDELLAEEEPDVLDEEDEDEESWDENATGNDVARLERDEDADPRAGRLATTEADVYGNPDEDVPGVQDGELLGEDTGIDGGAASAEEAAVHVVGEDDEELDDDDEARSNRGGTKRTVLSSWG